MTTSAEIEKSCRGRWIDNLKDAPQCNIYREQIIKDKCEWKSESINDLPDFNSLACKIHCKNIPNDGCSKLFQNYCKSDKDGEDKNIKYCLEFCNYSENKEGCLQSIKKSCSNKEITTDKFCQKTVSLVDKDMITIYETAMEEYCNNKEILDDDKKKIKNDFCACYDKELINQKYPNIQKDYIKNYVTANPQCYLDCIECTTDDCEKNKKAFKKTLLSHKCEIPICENTTDIYELINVPYDRAINININDPRCKMSESSEFVIPESESESDSETDSETDSEPVPIPASKSLSVTDYILIVFLIVIVIVFIVFIVFIIIRLKKRKRNIQYYNMQ